jgi:acyl-CoA synthetase (AMP-forming)/AMP-acid ligase II
MATEVSGRPGIYYYAPPWGVRWRVIARGSSQMNYANFIDRLVGVYGRRTAFLLDEPIDYPGFSGDVLSYDDVGRLVSRMAGALRALGVNKGDRVGLITMNRIEMAFCNFACGKLGAIPVPMNFMLRPSEIEFIVQKAGIEVLVVDPLVYGGTIKERAAVPSVKRWAMIGTKEPPDDIVALADAMQDQPDVLEPVEPASHDEVALLFFTSGTTGFPKGAMLTHDAAMIGIRTHARAAAASPVVKERLMLAVMPVAHAAGYATLLLNLGLGQPAYLLSKFDPQEIFRQVERLRPTTFAGTPAMFRMLLDAGAEQHDWSSIRVFGGGADVFDDELVRRVRRMGARRGPGGVKRLPWFVRGYGMAEANSHLAQTPPFPVGDACCGFVLPPVKYRLVDEDANDVPKGKPGELVIKGPNVTTGYWNDAEATEQAFTPDGWFRTADILRRGKWGMLYFVGRSNDIIKSGGYKISASEIDQVLVKHPDVEMSATVGIPHPVKGERPFSAVKMRPGTDTTPEQILGWLRERVAPYKCSRGIVPVDDIPMTFSMKPKRIDIRERLIAELPEDVRHG